MHRRIMVVVLTGFLCAGSAAADEKGDKVLASFDGQKITLAEFAEEQPALLSWVGISAGEEPLQAALENMVFSRLLAREAESSGFMDDPEVRAQVDKILSAAYYKSKIARNKIPVEEPELDQYYSANRAKYKSQELVKISHILTKSEADAEKVGAALKEGAKWSDLAAKYSIDPSTVKTGGAMGAVAPNSLLPEIREAIGVLQPGQISAPVKTSFGFHLLRLEDLPAVSYRPLDEVRKEIYSEVLRTKENKLKDELKRELWSKYDVRLNAESIKGLIAEKSAENVQVDKSSLGRQLRQPGQATQLQVIAESLDLGRLAAKKISHTILVANASGAPITIHRVGSTCPCIQASVERNLLAPGQTTKLTFVYDPDMLKEKGTSQKTIFIESTDTVEPRKFVRFNVELVRG